MSNSSSNSPRFLIANLCFHQVMAESLYHILDNLGTVHIISNEDTMPYQESIPKEHIARINTKPSFKSNIRDALAKRIGRLQVLLWIFSKRNNFDYLIFTAGVEYIPKGIRLFSYILIMMISRFGSVKVIETVHKISFWNDVFRNGVIRNRIFTHSNISALACVSDRILSLWKNKKLTDIPAIQIPFVVPSSEYIRNIVTTENRIVICVHGTATMKRRRYDLMYDAFHSIPESKRSSLEIVFQGPPVSAEDKSMINKLSDIVAVRWRDHYLSSDEMEVLMSESDILIAPLNTEYGYGSDNESGIGFDCLRYHIGGIVPKAVCSSEFAPVFMTYTSSEELKDIFLSIDKKTTRDYSNRAQKAAAQYTDKAWANKLKPLIFGLQ
jgi:hypothetical protein